MASKKAKATLLLRTLAMSFLAASVSIFLTNSFTYNDKLYNFKSAQSYRYAVYTASLGCIYSLFQVPFAIFHVATKEKVLIRWLPAFDFYADQLIGYILATAVGTSFGASNELKKVQEYSKDAQYLYGYKEYNHKLEKFLDVGYIASALLLLGFICVGLQTLISALNNRRTEMETKPTQGYA